MRVTSTPSSPIRPIGTDVVLTCTVVLNYETDSVMVDFQLSGYNPSFYRLVTTTSNTGFIYTSTAMIRSFGRNKSGIYSCSINGGSTSSFLRGFGQSVITRVTIGC